MKFYIKRVKGDGHCFYRCLYHMSCSDPNVADVLLEKNKNKDRHMILEDDGEQFIQLIRMKIASAFLEDEDPTFEDKDYMIASRMFQNALFLYKEMEQKRSDLAQTYPLLDECIKRCEHSNDLNNLDDLEEIMDYAYDVIAHSNTYASHIELEVTRHLLLDSKILVFVVSQNTNQTQKETSNKWLRDFIGIHKYLESSNNQEDVKMSILINVDNIHYNIFKVDGSYVFSWLAFHNCIADFLDSYSDSESDSDKD